jgi:hypothetical protein
VTDKKPIANRGWKHARINGRLPDQLTRCPNCRLHIYLHEERCPHCSADLVTLGHQQLAAIARAREALATLQRLFAGAEPKSES